MTELHFGGYVMAWTANRFHVRPCAVIAEDLGNALLRIREQAFKVYPYADGYHNHQFDVVQMPNDVKVEKED